MRATVTRAAAVVSTEVPSIDASTVDPRIDHIGNMVWFIGSHPNNAGSWSARVPLDPELLPMTVLDFAWAPMSIRLQFETGDWDARELLTQAAPLFKQALDRLVDPGGHTDVSVT
jgi:hypothetical protein